jgi:hypothetical protein
MSWGHIFTRVELSPSVADAVHEHAAYEQTHMTFERTKFERHADFSDYGAVSTAPTATFGQLLQFPVPTSDMFAVKSQFRAGNKDEDNDGRS